MHYRLMHACELGVSFLFLRKCSEFFNKSPMFLQYSLEFSIEWVLFEPPRTNPKHFFVTNGSCVCPINFQLFNGASENFHPSSALVCECYRVHEKSIFHFQQKYCEKTTHYRRATAKNRSVQNIDRKSCYSLFFS